MYSLIRFYNIAKPIKIFYFTLICNILSFQSVLKVVVPDELHGSILTKTLPARPHMTTKEVCKIIAHKARITNPQDFALYRLVDGEGMCV